MTTAATQLAIVNPAVRHDFVFIFEGINHNGNGDPDSENRPRQTDDGYAFTTPNSLLNRIYQTAADMFGVEIYATNDTNKVVSVSGGLSRSIRSSPFNPSMKSWQRQSFRVCS